MSDLDELRAAFVDALAQAAMDDDSGVCLTGHNERAADVRRTAEALRVEHGGLSHFPFDNQGRLRPT